MKIRDRVVTAPGVSGERPEILAMEDGERRQRAVCERWQTAFVSASADLKVGLARVARSELRPIHGLRLQPVGETCGWYIWAGGEMSQADDFFEPVHVHHLTEVCPWVLPYLGLPPGWRFLIDGKGYEDVWEDPGLLTRP